MNITLTHLKKMVQEALDEGKPDKGQKKSTSEWGSKRRKEEGGKYRKKSKEEAEEEKKLHRADREQNESLRLTSSYLKEMIQDELNTLQEKCKGRGCATPSEVDDYAKAIAADSDSADNPYAVAWKSARQPGSKKGRTVAEEKKEREYGPGSYDYKFAHKPENKRKHAARNQANRAAVKAGRKKVGDNNDVHHPEGYSDSSPTQVMSQSQNRGMAGEGGRKKK